MYSGSTLTRYSGRIMGVHQKFDRVSRRHLTKLLAANTEFPKIRKILHFEGVNGPDAIKRKSPAQDEPWHYMDPFNKEDNQLKDLIQDHYDKLVLDLKIGNQEKAAFEAAWLAHAIVDGLTPAHHYPYEAKLEEIRGESMHTRITLKDKLIMPGVSRTDQIKKNWKMWGPRGLMTGHGMFELGVATLVAPLNFSSAKPTKDEISQIGEIGAVEYFMRSAKEIAVQDLYHNYLKKGFTPKLTIQIRHSLAPTIIKTITLAWYQAELDSKKASK
jgi:hypothetical protein